VIAGVFYETLRQRKLAGRFFLSLGGAAPSRIIGWNAPTIWESQAMSIAVGYPHIVKKQGEPARLESHPRTRVAMIVMDYLARGLSADEIVRHYPYLQLAEVHSAMAYYYDHQQEVDDEIRTELDQLDKETSSQPQTPIHAKLKSKGLI
jgi:uncharacterized protein (DUF433 family)